MIARFQIGFRSLAAVFGWLALFHAAVPDAGAQKLPKELNVVVVSGEGAVNEVGQRVATEPAVRVEDENHKAVAGAVVVFTLPTDGATGEFGNHSKTLAVVTDSRGEAAAKGIRANQVPGKLPIHINASYRGLATHLSMMQFLTAPHGVKKGGGGKLAAIFLLIGGAAAGGAVVALRNKQTSTPAAPPTAPVLTPIGITAGTGTVGAPGH